MCNCSKPVTATECERIKQRVKDGRFFIYIIKDTGLETALVPEGENPSSIAAQRNFYNSDGELEYYHVREHPCVNEE
ncbi:hypothetical protein U9K52_08495 [Chryseobacterium sp. MHB01]|uniref:hypothetical protein n=1 Tax=Chryseobacterium sp. MHB01 TaxID=3109433 RepID=UPI002AFE08E4|nr:hypothetical protein [Chryseobacterium sp. MHB01]MEA1848947.1 hypothetical protein [Chryseobacterium sp. MHB01]